MQVERVNKELMTENRLPDGSRILVDAGNEKIVALNAIAGAAWEACSAPTTLAQMTAEMQRTVNPGVSEDLTADAIRQLEAQNLVRTSGASSRRAFMGKMGAVAALPVVAALTMSEQRAYAKNAASAIELHPAPPPPPLKQPWANPGPRGGSVNPGVKPAETTIDLQG
jgi:hypothetical protein